MKQREEGGRIALMVLAASECLQTKEDGKLLHAREQCLEQVVEAGLACAPCEAGLFWVQLSAMLAILNAVGGLFHMIEHGTVDLTFDTMAILNVGEGDTKLSFDPDNPQERIRAARIVRDMIRRGYVLLVEVEEAGKKIFRRAEDFDEAKCEYIIADFDPTAALVITAPGSVVPGISAARRVEAEEIAAAEATAQQARAEDERSDDAGTKPAADTGPERLDAGRERGARKRTRRVAADKTRSVAVPRSAGG